MVQSLKYKKNERIPRILQKKISALNQKNLKNVTKSILLINFVVFSEIILFSTSSLEAGA